ncbi:hypothetical protein [Jatrophihabitans fulvus]
MTRTQPHAVARSSLVARTMAVALGSGDDVSTVSWVAADAVAGVDDVHLVRPYLPLQLDGCTWQLVEDAQGRRRRTAARELAAATSLLHRLAPGLGVTGSVVAGLPSDVLRELSHVVDLLVVGADADDPGVDGPAPSCPVVRVPVGAPLRPGAPIVLALGDAGVSRPAFELAAEWALRRGVTLVVSARWSSVSPRRDVGTTWLADRQQSLDLQLSSWGNGRTLPPIAVRIDTENHRHDPEFDDAAVVVVDAGDASLVRGVRTPTVLV